MTKNKYAISIKDLVKTFGETTALDGLDLQVSTGEVHGLLGPNGAGKSTTIRVLLGLLRADSGEVSVLSQDPWNDAVELHKNLVYVPGEVNLWENLTGGEIIDLLTDLRGRESGNDKRRQELLEKFKLDPTKKFSTYSKGNRQKVALVAALASDVDLYILDEPTSGLDPLLEIAFQDEIKKLKTQGKTILLSSHILAEVEALCDTVTIIRDGKVVESGSLDKLRHLTRTTVRVTTNKSLAEVKSLQGVHDFKLDGHTAGFEVQPDQLNSVIAELTKLEIESIICHPPTIEELFMGHYRGKTANKNE